MTGWNLPPGVNVHDIPGNRPEDEDEEAFWTAFHEKVTEEFAQAEGILQDAYDLDFTSLVTRLIQIARDMGYKRGYLDGINNLVEEIVLGRCEHGIDLDKEFCPEGCRV